MKKRLIEKNNKKWMENNIFTPLKCSRIKVSWKKYLSGYYLWYYGKNNVVHFKIKNIPDIKFAVWHIDNNVEIFADFLLYIDKFKPTASTYNFKTINELIEFIKKFDDDYETTLANELIKETIDESYQKDADKNEILKEYYVDFNYSLAIERNNGLSENEIAKAKKIKNEFKELCNKFNIKCVHEIRPTIFFGNYGVFHMFVSRNTENINKIYNFIENMNNTYFCVKIHDNIKSYFKELKRQKKNKKYKVFTINGEKFY